MFWRFFVCYVLTKKDPQSCYGTTLFNIELNGWNLFYFANYTNEIVCISNVSIRLMSLVAILTPGQKKEYRRLHFQWKKNDSHSRKYCSFDAETRAALSLGDV